MFFLICNRAHHTCITGREYDPFAGLFSLLILSGNFILQNLRKWIEVRMSIT